MSIKHIPVSLTIDEIKVIRRAYTSYIQGLKRSLKEITDESIKEVVEEELICLRKNDLYLHEVLETEGEKSKPTVKLEDM